MIWKLRSQPRELRSLDIATEVQIESILASLPDDLRAQRRLGVYLSHSLLHLYEGPWLKEKWTKEKISFFAQETGKLDLHRPYITTDLSAYSSATSSPDLNRTHGNPSILSLAIILIEIHTGKPIEHFRKAEDLTNGTDVNINTDCTAALRVAKTLKNCSLNYQDAIQACLSMPWKTPGHKVSLDDQVTRDGVYEHIIRPPEVDLEHLFREKF